MQEFKTTRSIENGNIGEEVSKQWIQFLVILSAAFLAIGSGFQIGWSSPSLLKIEENKTEFPISPEEASHLVMIAPLGYLIGCPLSGFLLDKAGRKNTLLLLSLPQIISWILIATSTGIQTMYVARVLTGVADGALFTTLPIYIGEVVEPKIRGILSTSHSIGICVGILLINTYGSYLSIRNAAYVSLSAPLLFLVTFIWMPDSPYFLLAREKIPEARSSLRFLRRMKNVENELSVIKLDVERQLSEPGRYSDIFTNWTNLKAFLILMGLRTIQQMSGLSVFIFYSQVIFKRAGGHLKPSDSSIISYSVQVVVTCCSTLFLDRFGRRPLFLFSSISSGVMLFALGIYFTLQEAKFDLSELYWLAIAGMIINNVVASVGILVIPNVMAGELLSVSVKSKAVGIVNVYFGVLVSIGSIIFQVLSDYVGMFMPFYFFGTFCFIGVGFCYFCVPETKGKTLEQIQQVLRGSRQNKDFKGKKEVLNNLRETLS